jgi:hypothetical protein
MKLYGDILAGKGQTKCLVKLSYFLLDITRSGGLSARQLLASPDPIPTVCLATL